MSSSKLAYLHTDHLNTPRLATDSTQALLWRWNSDAYGVGAPEEDVDGDGVATSVALRFPGQIYDAQTQLNYNYFRDYNPATGRYVQSDPIGLEGGMNTCSYVYGNPILKVDPTGEIAFVPVLVGMGAGLVFDYAVSEWKAEHCKCEDAGTPAGAAGNAAVGAANGTFGPYATKPRTGIAGGGVAGSRTSAYSQTVSEAYQSGAISIGTRRVLRDTGRFISERLPYVSTALAAYEVYDVYNCD